MRITNSRTGRSKTGNILDRYLNSMGYQIVYLRTAKQNGMKNVHRLVAQAFIPNPENKSEVNHKNGKEKWNNAVENLEWVTTAENIRHACVTGLRRSAFTESDIFTTYKLYHKEGLSQRKIASMFRVRQSTVSKVLLGYIWRHLHARAMAAFLKKKPSASVRTPRKAAA